MICHILGTWAYPDDTKGLLTLFGNSKAINNLKGVYDYTGMRNVHIITASGVGGGSLVYNNVIVEPDESIYKDWPTQEDGKPPLGSEYFEMASKFIGINSITTTAGIGKFRLPQARVFQKAAKSSTVNKNLLNIESLDAKLSITDISATEMLLSKEGPLELDKDLEEMTLQELEGILHEIKNKYKKETNVCQRHGRCVLGVLQKLDTLWMSSLFKDQGWSTARYTFPLRGSGYWRNDGRTRIQILYKIS